MNWRLDKVLDKLELIEVKLDLIIRKLNEEKTIKERDCDECAGSGIATVSWMTSNSLGYVPVDTPCENCAGSGKIRDIDLKFEG